MQPEQHEILVAAMTSSADRFTGTPAAARDREAMLREIVDAAVATVPGAVYAGITMLERNGRITSTSPTAEVVARLDQAQAAMREGPCVTAVGRAARHASAADHTEDASDQSMISVTDMTSTGGDNERWPRFAGEALRVGVRSMLSSPLSGRRWPAAALNIFSDRPEAFDPTARTIAALFANQAAIALYGAEHATDLDRALASRDAIGQAKGILMERHRLGPDDAFRLLVEASQNANVKLHAVADWLIAGVRTPSSGGSASESPPAS